MPKMLEDEHRTDPGRILARATFNLRNFRPSCTPRPNSLTRIAPVKRRLMYARLKKTKEEEGKTDLRKFDGPISFALFDRHTGLITRISREQNMHEQHTQIFKETFGVNFDGREDATCHMGKGLCVRVLKDPLIKEKAE